MKQKYKIGDKVLVIANDCEHKLEIGYIGIIEEYESNNDFKVDFW